KARYVYLKERTTDALRSWLSVRPSGKGDAVFVGLRGPLTESGIYQVLRRLAKAADIEGRHNPHSMRHGWARGALRNGADISDVSQILGHSDIAVTVKFYGQWADDELKERHDQFSWLPEG
ncbi:MAG: tyrosine-type recombinase/integrase, partial [Anaerolineae bacterium]|nr:tyrosine-type recombinase/integrase [Anaerolineae bacterium]